MVKIAPERDLIMATVCAELGAASVQHIGKTLVVWREKRSPGIHPGTPSDKPKAGLESQVCEGPVGPPWRSLAECQQIVKPHWFAAPGKSSRGRRTAERLPRSAQTAALQGDEHQPGAGSGSDKQCWKRHARPQRSRRALSITSRK